MNGYCDTLTRISRETALAFDEPTHIYTLNGARIPSVTHIMRPMSMMLYEAVPTDTLDEAAARGTRAHEAISNIVNYGIREDDPDTAGYIDAYERFANERAPVWLASEFRAHHKNLMYAGTLDLIGFVEPDDGGGVDVVDIKTTRIPTRQSAPTPSTQRSAAAGASSTPRWRHDRRRNHMEHLNIILDALGREINRLNGAIATRDWQLGDANVKLDDARQEAQDLRGQLAAQTEERARDQVIMVQAARLVNKLRDEIDEQTAVLAPDALDALDNILAVLADCGKEGA